MAASSAELGDSYWVPDEDAAWLPCQLRARDGDDVIFVAGDGRKLRRPARLLPTLQRAGRGELAGLDDICSLDSVWEGAVLHTLRERYRADKIYTRISRGILVAVNPFRFLPELYSESVQAAYREAADCGGLPPHVFGIAQDASQRLRLPDAKDQAVLVSGESGAGKTESTKHILTFLMGHAQGGGMEEKILSTNPVLEAFGNAATTRNRNSSRFGKWLDVRLSHAGGVLTVHGCTLTHYLLETTRVSKHAMGESAYHIFYRLLQAPAELLGDLGLLSDPEAYNYLSGSADHRPGGLEPVQTALAALGVDEELQRDIFRTLAGILLLGNCEFAESDLTEAGVGAAWQAAELLGLEPSNLVDCMLVATRHIGRNEVTRTPRRPEEARGARDGLARMLYDSLFDWLMRRMNRSLMPSPTASSGASFGVLDIAGFENFGKNSLEQLLINLSNEYLQQSFNDSIFKAELQDCEAEGVPIAGGLGFSDNLDCLELLDGTAGTARQREPGILDLLDEAVSMPSSTDAAFVAKVVSKFKGGHSRFKAPRFGGCPAFTVRHFAGDITYSCDGWVEKNSDRPPARAVELLAESQFSFVQCLGAELRQTAAAQGRPAGRGSRAQSASYPFRTSLRALMTRMARSELHFVRCIKPREREEGHFCAHKVTEQLRSSGILEAVRIRQSGYGSRWSFSEFAARFSCVASSLPALLEPRAAAEALVPALQAELGEELGENDLIVGRSKVFARTSAAASLEARRARSLEASALLLQRASRVLLSRLQLRAAQEERATASPAVVEPCEGVPAALHEQSAQPSSSSSALPRDLFDEAQPMPPASSADEARQEVSQGASSSDQPQGKELRLVEELRVLQAAVQSRDEGLLMRALEGVEQVRFVEELLAAARGTLAPLQRAREALDHALTNVAQSASEDNVDALRRSISQAAAAGLSEDRLTAARAALRDAQSAAPRAALQRVEEALSAAVKTASSKPTELNMQLLRRAIEQGSAAGLCEQQLAGAREAVRELQRAAAQAVVQRAAEALDRAERIMAHSATATNIQVLQRALEQAVTASLPEERLSAARKMLADARWAFALKALARAREALDGSVKSSGSARSTLLDANVKSLQGAIEQGEAVGLPEAELAAARASVLEARRVPALAALQRAQEALSSAVRNDASNLPTVSEVLRGAIDRGAAAGLSEDELAAARQAIREAPVASAVVALRVAREAVDVALGGTDGQLLHAKTEALQRTIERGTSVGVSEEQLAAAREVLREVEQASSLDAVQHAREALALAVRGDEQDVAVRIEVLRRAVDRATATGLAEHHLERAREAIREAPRDTALVALQRARTALESAVRGGDSSVAARADALQRAIARGVTVGLPADDLMPAREAVAGAPRAVALVVLQRTREALDTAVSHNDEGMDARREALQRAIDTGAAAGLDAEELAPAREAVREALRTSALLTLQRAHSGLDATVQRAEDNVDASLAALQAAIRQGVAAGLSEEQLAGATAAAQAAPKAAAAAALRKAYDGLHGAVAQSIVQLEVAVERSAAVGGAELSAARATLQQAKALAALAALQRAREALRSAAWTDRQMASAVLMRTMVEAEAAGVAADQLAAARADAGQAAVGQAAAALAAAVTAAGHCPSERNVSLLERAIEQAASLGADGLAAARRALEEARNAEPVEECSICFEQEETSLMPCCGRVGSGMRICSSCLAQHTSHTREPRCPFCRARIA